MEDKYGKYTIEIEGDNYYLVHNISFDYTKEAGYKSERIVKQQIVDFTKTLDNLSKDISLIDQQIKEKEDLTNKMLEEMKDIWDSHEFKTFEQMFELKYKNLVSALSKKRRYDQEVEQLKNINTEREVITHQMKMIEGMKSNKYKGE